MFPWSKGPDLKARVAEYVDKVEACLDRFVEAMHEHLENPLSDRFHDLSRATREAESDCDDTRRQIERLMYEKALIPESREAVLQMIERIDKVPNKAESVCRQAANEFITIPPDLVDTFATLVERSRDSSHALCKAARVLFEDTDKVGPLCLEVDHLESECDDLEQQLIRAIFSDDRRPVDQKILIRDLVLSCGNISDRAETASDLITIIAVKRIV